MADPTITPLPGDSDYEGGACPYCGAVVEDTIAEVAHMNDAHPEVIEERMLAAGFQRLHEPDGPWIDQLQSDE